MGLPEKKLQLKNTGAANNVTSSAYRTPSNLPAGRTPSHERAHSVPAPSRCEEPQNASEPPKVLVRRDVQPMTQRTRSSSAGARKKTDGREHLKTSKVAANSKLLPKEASSQSGRVSDTSAQAKLSQKDIQSIESHTRGQRNNPDWHKWRQNRITASMAHQISHSRFANQKTTDIPQSYLKAILGTGPKVQTAAMSWGIKNEKCAVRNYEKQALKNKGREVQVEDCGLFIHPTKNWLAASPDGIVKDKITGENVCILEVKCPYKHRYHTIQEACADRDFCLAVKGDSYVLKPNHAYYTQVQCQLASTGMKDADFVVYTNKETVVVPLKFNPDFWKETEPKLEMFYNRAVVPNIREQNPAGKEQQKYNIYAPEE
ncbi:uncharacterized protein [Pyxicephalus adspersus]|uniref:YqaJ viral recombinase domain-containing protein n=1 Tax=Pyxicephalus adspersus TaxID=30357 RepID=A0AAV3AIL9_PYXAD|nr:TPA: hypothetical protein GDO54_010609 [Pyxicephalus adspersus]